MLSLSYIGKNVPEEFFYYLGKSLKNFRMNKRKIIVKKSAIMTFLANHKDLFIWFLQYFRAQGFFEILPFADVSQTLVFLMASHSISIYLFATCFTLQYCANREDVLIFFLFYDPEFLHSRQRFHLSFFPFAQRKEELLEQSN